MVRANTYDVIVLGGGPAGENAAQYAIQGSHRTAAIVETELVGGECSYWACMPSKALLRPVEVLSMARAVPGMGDVMQAQSLDISAVLARRDQFTHSRDDSSQVQWAKDNGIDIVRGHGRVAGVRTVQVISDQDEIQILHARLAVVIATGTTAAIPEIPGLHDALPWTSRDVTNLTEIPQHVAVIGGGVVACEAATWLRGLGAEVTLIETAHSLLGRAEPFAGELIQKALTKAGVRVVTDADIDKVSRPDAVATGVGKVHGGKVTLRFGRLDNDAETIEVNEIVVAAGRIPTTRDLGLEQLETANAIFDENGFLQTDDHLTVMGIQGAWLYAVGDVSGRAMLTHMGKYQARIAGWVIAARAAGRSLDGVRLQDLADTGWVPQVAFTNPQVASVGHTERSAHDAGIDVKTVEYDMADVAGASLLVDDYQGRAKLVIDRGANVVVGATFVGPEVAELVHAATIAVVGRVPIDMLWHAVPSYPTVSEVWLRLLESL